MRGVKGSAMAVEESRRRRRERMAATRKTLRGRLVSIYNGMRSRAGNRDGRHPAYASVKLLLSRDEFLAWAIPAFSRWMLDHPGERPSIDRIQFGDYELGNLQILSILDNTRKQKHRPNMNAPEGMAWCSRCQKHLPRTAFAAHSANPVNGLQSYCKDCNRAYRQANRERRQAYDRTRTKKWKTSHGRNEKAGCT